MYGPFLDMCTSTQGIQAIDLAYVQGGLVPMQSSTRPCFNLTLKKGILGSLIKHINARLRIIIIIAACTCICKRSGHRWSYG